MKNKIWSILLGVVALAGCAQLTPVSVEDQNKPIVVTVACPGKTQDQLYMIARQWFLRERKLGNDGGQIINDDKKTAFFAQVLTSDIPCEGNGVDCQSKKYSVLSYKLRIDTKDELVTMTYTDFVESDPQGEPQYHNPYRKHPIEFQADLDMIKKGVDVWAKELIASVKKDRSLTTDGLPAVNE